MGSKRSLDLCSFWRCEFSLVDHVLLCSVNVCRFLVFIWTNGLWTGDWVWLVSSCTPSSSVSPSSSNSTSSSSSTSPCAETSTDSVSVHIFFFFFFLSVLEESSLALQFPGALEQSAYLFFLTGLKSRGFNHLSPVQNWWGGRSLASSQHLKGGVERNF